MSNATDKFTIKVLYGTFDDTKNTWTHNPLLSITPQEQLRHNICTDQAMMIKYALPPEAMI